MEYEVVCKDLGYPHEGGTVIIHLGLKDENSSHPTVFSKGDIIDMMLKQHRFFFVNKDGFKTYLVLRNTANGHLYVETMNDKTKLDNLYALPTCTKDEVLGQSAGGADPDDNGPEYQPGGGRNDDPDDSAVNDTGVNMGINDDNS